MSIFMNFEGIKGQATEKGHKDWIVANSIAFHMERPISTKPGNLKNREQGLPVIRDLIVTQDVDQATIPMLQEATTGSTGKLVQIDITQVGKSADVYMSYKLYNVLVSSYTIDSHNNTRPSAVFTLNFSKMEITYTGFDVTNKGEAPMAAYYDAETVNSG